MYIKKVWLYNIKCHEKLEIAFEEGHEAGWHVILGENGAGKSSTIQALGYGLLGANTARSLTIKLRDWIRSGTKESQIWLEIEKHDLDRATGSGRGKRQGAFELGLSITPLNGEWAKAEVIEDEFAGVAESMLWGENSGWFSAGFGPFRRFYGGDQTLNRVFHADPRAAGHLSLFWEAAELQESLIWLRELHFKRAEGHEHETMLLQKFLDFFNYSGLLAHGVLIQDVTSDGVFFVDGNGISVHVSKLSDGYRSMLSMMFELMRRLLQVYGHEQVFRNWKQEKFAIDLPGVVLIDEIDVHLHPTWQVTIGEWFMSVFPLMQFIVTTHSPLICRAAERGSIWKLPEPGTKGEIHKVSDLEYKRLVFGDILDAYGTDVFGEDLSVSQSEETKRLHRRKLELQAKSMDGLTSDAEEAELDELRSYL